MKYVGLTKSGFHRRMYNYQKPGSTQRTSLRLNEIIAEQLGAGTMVEIYIAVPPALELERPSHPHGGRAGRPG